MSLEYEPASELLHISVKYVCIESYLYDVAANAIA